MRDESTLPLILRQDLPPEFEKIKNGRYTRNDADYPIHLYLQDNDINVVEEGSEIVNFLKGKVVLVTGATGFLGKLLVEKLLRACSDIGQIYIIVRNKKGKTLKSRVDEYLEGWVFQKLARIRPNYKEKVTGISGDFELEGIGLSEESKLLIKEKVNIIYHVAATVRFDEKLKKAVAINLRGTQVIVGLAKTCRKLDVFVHMSTAYSNCNQKVIKEEFYSPKMNPYQLMTVVNELPEDVLDRITANILDTMPNTYAFTKQLAEDLVRREALGIPACIQRPSIVMSAVKEPVKSWIDSNFGPAGLMLGVALGIIHITRCRTQAKCDLVPADYVINSLIASSYQTAKDKRLDKIQIFNYTSNENPLRWADLCKTEEQGIKVASKRILWKTFYKHASCFYVYSILNVLFHTLPGHTVDFILVKLGHKPMLTNAYKKVNKFDKMLSYFALNEWTFDNSNTKQLWKSLNKVDQNNFAFDMSTLDWQNYFDTFIIALREFLMMDYLDYESLVEGRKRFFWFQVIHYVSVGTMLGLSHYFLLNTMFFFVPLAIAAIILYYMIPKY